MRAVTRTVALLALAWLTACAAQTGETSEPTPEDTEPTASRQPSREPAPGEMELTGILDSEAVEGGCPHLRAEDGTRYEILWPTGWELDRATLELTNPEGEVVARAGDTVTVWGRPAEDVASICMIGPIFGATEVIIP